MMIIQLRFIQNFLISSMLTSPPWGNGEVVLGLEWHKVVGPAKVVGDYVRTRIFVKTCRKISTCHENLIRVNVITSDVYGHIFS